MIYLDLFLSFLQIGAFSFGGGYAAMPLIQEQVVNRHLWLTQAAFTDLVTIAEMTPGPIAINAATFVGTQVGGPRGAVLATLGCIAPSCIFVTALAWLYTKYKRLSLLQGILKSLRPAVVSMIAAAGLTILISAFFAGGVVRFAPGCLEYRSMVYFAAAFYLLRKKHWNPIAVMVLCGVMETAVCLL